MDNEHKKVQIVVTADYGPEGPMVLLLQTNEARGSFWQNITGSVEKNESYSQAALRELQEETGIQANNNKLKELEICLEFTDQFQREVKEKCFWIYLEQVPDAIQIDPKEHKGFRWVPLSELEADAVKYPSNYQCLKKVQDLLNEASK